MGWRRQAPLALLCMGKLYLQAVVKRNTSLPSYSRENGQSPGAWRPEQHHNQINLPVIVSGLPPFQQRDSPPRWPPPAWSQRSLSASWWAPASFMHCLQAVFWMPALKELQAADKCSHLFGQLSLAAAALTSTCCRATTDGTKELWIFIENGKETMRGIKEKSQHH